MSFSNPPRRHLLRTLTRTWCGKMWTDRMAVTVKEGKCDCPACTEAVSRDRKAKERANGKEERE